MKRRAPKLFVRLEPNPVDCIYGGALPLGGSCFASDRELVHVECLRASRAYLMKRA